MKIARIPLQPHSRFHFGELKMDDNLALSTSGLHAHSDTLFAALVNGYSNLQGGAEDLIKHFKNGEIKISSLFYYLQRNDAFVYFLPKPVFLDMDSPKTNDGKHKLRNSVKFVSIGTWENGLITKNWMAENGGYHIIDNRFVVTDKEFERMGMDKKSSICSLALSPKSPQRAHDNAAIFYQTDVVIGDNPNFSIGWYFMYEAIGAVEDKLKTAVNIMAYTGIGGEKHNTGRTVPGNPEFAELIMKTDKASATHFLNLSLFCPHFEGIEFEKAKYYTTTLRGGRKTQHGQAKVVRMVEEGALLTADVVGCMVEIGKDELDRPIQRLGIPLNIAYSYEKR